MNRRAFLLALLAAPATLGAQRAAVLTTCSFDTVAHTDTLRLEFSLRAFRGDDTLPDFTLTLGLGDIIGPRFRAPPSIGELLAPNTYFPTRHPNGFTEVFGTLQFELTPEGNVNGLRWFAGSLDAATDAAIDAAIQAAVARDEPKVLATSLGLKKTQKVRLQFLATQDAATHAPLALMRVPMIRADSGGEMIPRTTQAVLVPRDMVVVDTDAAPVFEFTIDEHGLPVKQSIQIISAPSLDRAKSSLRYSMGSTWKPAYAGGCPIMARMRTGAGSVARVKM